MHPAARHVPRLALAMLLCTGAVACSKKVKDVPPPASADPSGTRAAGTGIGTAGTSTGTVPAPSTGLYTAADLERDACLRTRQFYFDLDRDNVKPEFQNAILCHAKYLRDRPGARLTLEGHTDERGSQEYNLGLGERRGNAVLQALQAQGASSNQVTVVSYGEERPECREGSEACWSRNRRVDLEYSVP